MSDLQRYNKTSWLETVWDALQGFREDCISTDDEQWDEICTAMAWITEELGFEFDTQPNSPTNGELVRT
jgi:hypothetical protein